MAAQATTGILQRVAGTAVPGLAARRHGVSRASNARVVARGAIFIPPTPQPEPPQEEEEESPRGFNAIWAGGAGEANGGEAQLKEPEPAPREAAVAAPSVVGRCKLTLA